jgi:hypothetical protein
MHPILFLADGPSFDPAIPNAEVIQYAIVGLPPRRNVLIGKKDGRWRILRVRDNVPDSWRGDYETADAALADLAAELRLEAESGRTRSLPPRTGAGPYKEA